LVHDLPNDNALPRDTPKRVVVLAPRYELVFLLAARCLFRECDPIGARLVT